MQWLGWIVCSLAVLQIVGSYLINRRGEKHAFRNGVNHNLEMLRSENERTHEYLRDIQDELDAIRHGETLPPRPSFGEMFGSMSEPRR